MPNTIEVYDWFEEVEPLLLMHLGETERSWHGSVEVDGVREYRNFWHVFIHIYDRIRNDSWFRFHDLEGPCEYLRGKLVKEYGEWALRIIPAINSTLRELKVTEDDEGNRDIVVWISW